MALFTNSKNETQHRLAPRDFQMIMQTSEDTLGEIYTQGLIGSLWWTAVSTIFFANESLYGQNAASYIETMEARCDDGESLAQYVYWWLQEHGNTADLTEEAEEIFETIVKEPNIRIIRHDEMFEESQIFKPFGLKDTMAMIELDEVYAKATSWYEQKREESTRSADAPDALKEFDETVSLIFKNKLAASEQAKVHTRKTIETLVPVSSEGISPEYAYVLVSRKIEPKIDSYLQKAKRARRTAVREGQKADNHSSNVTLLTAQLELINKVLHEANDIEKSNPMPEIVEEYEERVSQNLDVPANFAYNQEQGNPQ
jgi:hypothetical protein